MPMMAMTTRSSTSVNPFRRGKRDRGEIRLDRNPQVEVDPIRYSVCCSRKSCDINRYGSSRYQAFPPATIWRVKSGCQLLRSARRFWTVYPAAVTTQPFFFQLTSSLYCFLLQMAVRNRFFVANRARRQSGVDKISRQDAGAIASDRQWLQRS